jgi:glycosyltransferase involved in cell wall biosynthesis
MRIVIDMQGAQNGSRFRGIGRYTTAFAKSLIREASSDEVILVLNAAFSDTIEPIRLEFSALVPQSQILIWSPLSPVHFLDQNNDGRRLASEAIRECFLASLNPDVIIITSMFEGAGDNVVSSIGTFVHELPTAAILYDFIPLIYSKEYLADVRVNSWYMNKLHQMMKADLLLSISESSRNEGILHLGADEDSIVNISTAIEPNFSQTCGTPFTLLKEKFNISREYLMYSGASDPRKNLPRLLEAYSKLTPALRRKYQLLLAGGMPQDHILALKNQMADIGLDESEVCITGHITDDEMIGLYRGALGFVFASYHEGFGLPVLEAMAFDVPVIGSNISSIPEVIGNNDALFDPFSVTSITAAMDKLLTDEPFRKGLIDKSRKQRRLFTWELTAKKALAALRVKFDPVNSFKCTYLNLPPITQQRLLTEFIASVLTDEDTSEKSLLRVAAGIDFIFPRSDQLKRLFVDVSELKRSNSRTGIQRVVSNVFANLRQHIPANFQLIPVFATRDDDYKEANQFRCKFFGFDENQETDSVVDFRNGDIFLGLDYQDQIIVDRSNYYEDLKRAGVSVYFVVYDLLPQLLENTFIDEVSRNNFAWLTTVAKSDGLICISKSVADELQAWLTDYGPIRKDPLKIGWFHLGADYTPSTPRTVLTLEQKGVLNRISDQQSFLVVSTIEPRKRQEQVLNGFEILWTQGEDVCLVLVGKRGWMVDDLIKRLDKHPERNSRLFWLEAIDDEYLRRVYESSSCLIAASAGEGFGLSLVEAAQHKLPILARDIPVFREVAGAHATYFRGTEGSDIVAAVQTWRRLKKLDTMPQSEHLNWLTWQESSLQLTNIIFDSNWYHEWCHDGAIRFSGSDSRLGSQVGLRRGSKLSTDNKAGFLVYGPYAQIPHGRYQISVKGSSLENQHSHASVEVVMQSGQRVLGKEKFLAVPTTNTLASLEVDIPPGCMDLEVRVKVTEKADFLFSQISIKDHSTL